MPGLWGHPVHKFLGDLESVNQLKSLEPPVNTFKTASFLEKKDSTNARSNGEDKDINDDMLTERDTDVGSPVERAPGSGE